MKDDITISIRDYLIDLFGDELKADFFVRRVRSGWPVVISEDYIPATGKTQLVNLMHKLGYYNVIEEWMIGYFSFRLGKPVKNRISNVSSHVVGSLDDYLERSDV